MNAFDRFNTIIDTVEARCLATDGPVTPTLQEMREVELAELWRCVQDIRATLSARVAEASGEAIGYVSALTITSLKEKKHANLETVFISPMPQGTWDQPLYASPQGDKALREALDAEREACAKIAREQKVVCSSRPVWKHAVTACKHIEDAISARALLSPSPDTPASGGGELAELRATVERLTKERDHWRDYSSGQGKLIESGVFVRNEEYIRLTAAEARLAPSPDTQGMVLVPREPTSSMCVAGWKIAEERDAILGNGEIAMVWRAMIAALTSTAEKGEGPTDVG
jgi:hypothetical protein